MTRIALYARYSSDSQSESFIEDQLRLCRETATRERWEIAGSYQNAAISGGTILRPRIQKLVRDAQQGQFTVLLAEAGPDQPRSGGCRHPLQASEVRRRHHRHTG